MSSRIDEIRKRLEAATPGPWKQDEYALDVVWAPGRRQDVLECDGYEANAAFIAHAPDDIRWLLGEVERLRGYGQHHMDCAVVHDDPNQGPDDPVALCDFGLDP